MINKCKSSRSIIPFITVDGLKQYSSTAIANSFGKFYPQMGSNLANQPSKTTIDSYISRIPHTINSLLLMATGRNEIEKIITELQNKTSCGHDQISNNLLKALSKSISYLLEIIFNQSILQAVFQDLMKVPEVILLYKGKDQDEVVNYRPISLLITVSKLLEKIVYKHVYNFLDQHDVQYQSQYGLQSKHSCSQAIAELTGKLLQDKEAGLQSASVFLDLSKAFNMLDHHVLCSMANDWFPSYLMGRCLTANIQMKPGETTLLIIF